MWPKKIGYRLEWDDSYIKYLVLYIYFTFLMVFAFVLLFVSNDVSDRKEEPIDSLMQMNAIKVSVALSLVSFVIILIAVIGCCATYTKRKLILFMFCLLLVILVFIECFSTYNSFRFNSKLRDNKIDDRFKDLTLKYKWFEKSMDRTNKTFLVDSIQISYNCCGTHSYESWDELKDNDLVNQDDYPSSCCDQILNNKRHFCPKYLVNQTNSCFSSLNQRLAQIRHSVSIMAGFAITNSIIQILGIPLVWYFGGQLFQTENFIV